MRSDSSFSVMETGGITVSGLSSVILFFQKSERILTREQIILKLWGYEYTGNDRASGYACEKCEESTGGLRKLYSHDREKGYILKQI